MEASRTPWPPPLPAYGVVEERTGQRRAQSPAPTAESLDSPAEDCAVPWLSGKCLSPGGPRLQKREGDRGWVAQLARAWSPQAKGAGWVPGRGTPEKEPMSA